MTEEGSAAHKPGFWERLDTPTKVVAAVVAIIGGLVGAAATGAALFGGGKETVVVVPTVPPVQAPVAAQRITDCMRVHNMSTPRLAVGLPRGPKIVFKRCDWPPLVKSSADGYTEVRAERTELPRGNAWNNTLDAFHGPCDRMDVTFVHVHMGERRFVSRRLAVGRLYDITWVAKPRHRPVLRLLNRLPEELWEYDVPTPSADSRQFHVFYSGHFWLFDAHCGYGRPPS